MREYQIVSAPIPCGVAWLVNVLLELDIRATHVSELNRDGHWLPKGEGVEICPREYGHLRWFLPVLHERTDFMFQPDIEVFWEHRLDFARRPERPTILFTRDARDAVYSQFRRHNVNELSFGAYVSRPDTWPDHFPGMFRLPLPETWAWFHLFWLGMRKVMEIKIVRFEDARARPVQVVEDVLAFLGVSRPRGRIQQAVESSTFERAREAMEKMAAETGREYAPARKGKAGEWRETYDHEMLKYFNGAVSYAMAELGYSAADTMAASVPDKAQKPLMDYVTKPAVREALVLAEAHFRSGWAGEALHVLAEALRECGGHRMSLLACANTATALLWTTMIFPMARTASPEGQAAFDTFREINERFISNLAVQRAMLETIALDNPEL